MVFKVNIFLNGLEEIGLFALAQFIVAGFISGANDFVFVDEVRVSIQLASMETQGIGFRVGIDVIGLGALTGFFGVSQLTKSLAGAWAGHGIRVNAIAPGFIVTAQSEAARNDEEHYRKVIQRTPMERWGEPDDLAGPVLYLCSSAASFVTGVTLAVDGGYSAV